MARQIRNLIELSKSQTEEFLSSLSNPKNTANFEKTVEKARRTKFNVVL